MYNEQEFRKMLQQMKKAQVALEVAIGLFGFEHPTTLDAAEKLEKCEEDLKRDLPKPEDVEITKGYGSFQV